MNDKTDTIAEIDPTIKQQLEKMVELEQGDCFIWPSKKRARLWIKLLNFIVDSKRYVDRTRNSSEQIDKQAERIAELEAAIEAVKESRAEHLIGSSHITEDFIWLTCDKALGGNDEPTG